MLWNQQTNDGSPVRTSPETTHAGLPLSASRAPADDLKPWAARVFTTNVEMPQTEEIVCSFLADCPSIRMLFTGDWTATSKDGHKRYKHEGLFFGPQSRAMPISVRGSFSTLTIMLRPGATHAFGAFPLQTTVDRIVPFKAFGIDQKKLYARFADKDEPEEKLLEIEQIMREYLAFKKGRKPDPLTEAFDLAAFSNSNMLVSEFAEEQRVAQKTVERIVKRDFGLSPKKVLRRARVLDMAATLCGVADKDEADELALRYFDQSHLSRDFATFFGMTPAQFAAKQQPLMTLALEVRQARRLELLGRLNPGERRPWQA